MAVSAAQVGLVSRLWSLLLAAVVLHDWVPDLAVEAVACDPDPSASWQPALPRAGAPAGLTTAGASGIGSGGTARRVVDTVRVVSDACARAGRTSPRVLVSNAASSLHAAAGVLARHRPASAGDAEAVVRGLLTDPWLATGWTTTDRGFTRTGCCLYYRLPEHGLCPDCVLVRPGHPADEHH